MIVKHSTHECTSELQSMNVSLWVLTQGGKKKLKNSLMGDTLFLRDCETQYARVYKRPPNDERVTLGSHARASVPIAYSAFYDVMRKS